MTRRRRADRRPRPTRAIFLTRPLGDPGGIQEYSRGLLSSKSVDLIHVGSEGPARASRSLRAVRRGLSAAHAYAAAVLRPGTPVIVGHLRLVEILPTALISRRLLVIVYGREVEDLHPVVQWLWNWAAAHDYVHFAAISEATAELATGHGWDVTSWSQLPPALWSERSLSRPRPRTDDTLRVITISRLSSDSRRKNVDVLIQAVAAIHAAGLPVELTIVGDGGLKDELSNLAANVAPGIVKFVGRVDDAERTRLLCDSHVFALPSEQEGFGLVVLEAWEAGLAVVGCRRRALGEIIDDGKTGLTPEPDVSSVAAALTELFDEGTRMQLAAAGQRVLVAKYSPEAFDERLRATLLGVTEA